MAMKSRMKNSKSVLFYIQMVRLELDSPNVPKIRYLLHRGSYVCVRISTSFYDGAGPFDILSHE